MSLGLPVQRGECVRAIARSGCRAGHRPRRQSDPAHRAQPVKNFALEIVWDDLDTPVSVAVGDDAVGHSTFQRQVTMPDGTHHDGEGRGTVVARRVATASGDSLSTTPQTRTRAALVSSVNGTSVSISAVLRSVSSGRSGLTRCRYCRGLRNPTDVPASATMSYG